MKYYAVVILTVQCTGILFNLATKDTKRFVESFTEALFVLPFVGRILEWW